MRSQPAAALVEVVAGRAGDPGAVGVRLGTGDDQAEHPRPAGVRRHRAVTVHHRRVRSFQRRIGRFRHGHRRHRAPEGPVAGRSGGAVRRDSR
ncbi:hypothetical protein [Nocardiopsis dassonvillei]|uniref:hypothetical protein n=1 Tax=Nocardiopsis dassonvillei TaxID=2014 RepID=UPI003F548877